MNRYTYYRVSSVPAGIYRFTKGRRGEFWTGENWLEGIARGITEAKLLEALRGLKVTKLTVKQAERLIYRITKRGSVMTRKFRQNKSKLIIK